MFTSVYKDLISILKMNKKGNGQWLFGFILLVVGLLLSLGGFYIRCVLNKNGIYDTAFLNQCLTNPFTWLIFGIGAIIATIGAFVCRNSNR